MICAGSLPKFDQLFSGRLVHNLPSSVKCNRYVTALQLLWLLLLLIDRQTNRQTNRDEYITPPIVTEVLTWPMLPPPLTRRPYIRTAMHILFLVPQYLLQLSFTIQSSLFSRRRKVVGRHFIVIRPISTARFTSGPCWFIHEGTLRTSPAFL